MTLIRPDHAAIAEQEELERQAARDALEAKRSHEYEMAKLKLQIKPRNDTWRTLFKAPTFPIVVIAITILTLAGKDIPVTLTDFISK